MKLPAQGGMMIISVFVLCGASAFEGRITATITSGGQSETLVYTLATNQLRIELGETNRPYPKDLVNLDTGEITILFPHNRSFVRLKPSSVSGPLVPGTPPIAMPPGFSPGAGVTNLPGAPGPGALPPRPAGPGIGPQPMAGGTPLIPIMPGWPTAQAPLTATSDSTNLLGYPCLRYELKLGGDAMEIWATDKLAPFADYLQTQPRHFGPQMLREQWGGLLKARKLFPIRATLKSSDGVERMRFQVNTVKAEKIEDAEKSSFQPPQDYQEIRPLPF